jgi:hypothetical protein
MKKELQDYLHLYLGCECRCEYNYNHTDILTRIDNKFHGDHGACQLNSETWYAVSMVKPILRPLSDMTDEEAVIVWDTIHPDGGNRKQLTDNDIIRQGKSLVYSACYMTQIPVTFELTRFLLSRHFDLFGLIPAGLAIDKTTLK